MQYDMIMMSREHHQERVERLAQSYSDAQADSKTVQMFLANGIERISNFFAGLYSQGQQSATSTHERNARFAPVILDDRRGDSW
jgi:hypothetical protein